MDLKSYGLVIVSSDNGSENFNFYRNANGIDPIRPNAVDPSQPESIANTSFLLKTSQSS